MQGFQWLWVASTNTLPVLFTIHNSPGHPLLSAFLVTLAQWSHAPMLARIYVWTNDAKLRKTSFSSTVQNLGETVCAWTWCLQKLHTTAYVQLQYTYKLTYMEFTTLIIMVGHVDPDIPLTNVQVSVTRIMLWRVCLISRIYVPWCRT